ncbi:nucleotidyl transferase AbiEii/AbiGii toxin family protein [Ramlibacter pallidus]|uniref:Nucleotidyl transferase AbiEii/AbiGii toxin family protein n=1 Tax=Ramlibacter pallidus TaxID=2780087 RepID=A0ABR9S2J0_9BURK|nr:nucleotidyl transferase AbiEii/AbiGii toxin family protein [Ramlibacter pallidus]MBE7367664.1 nucleotidyl transferase AbiEii/AbiGii toxin family protein [Ramlibacter pallidus]
MFERAHHRDIALVLQSLDPDVLAARRCFFGGGTAMALLYGEYRESVDIDFLVSDRAGYRELREMLGGVHGLTPLLRSGMRLELAREVRTDQYGIRTHVRAGASLIKFEIVFEGRIELAPPEDADRVCGVTSLSAVDLCCEKLLANADRWPDDAVFSRDLIDLAMQHADRDVRLAASDKAEAAYGQSVRRALADAVQALRNRPHRLDECMQALRMTTVSRAQLWQRIRALAAALPVRDP